MHRLTDRIAGRRWPAWAFTLALAVLLAACNGGGTSTY